jgi:hypothetical protein
MQAPSALGIAGPRAISVPRACPRAFSLAPRVLPLPPPYFSHETLEMRCETRLDVVCSNLEPIASCCLPGIPSQGHHAGRDRDARWSRPGDGRRRDFSPATARSLWREEVTPRAQNLARRRGPRARIGREKSVGPEFPILPSE